jgi:N utilization substance protein B
MGKRRKGREVVLQSAYAWRLSGRPLADCLAEQLERRETAEDTATFARGLARTLLEHQEEAESWLRRLLAHWDLERVGVIERLILEIGLCELRHHPEVPWRVVINEACELARRYCDEEAVRFVNGILDRAAGEVLQQQLPPAGGKEGA